MWVVVALCSLIALTALILAIPVDLDARVEVHGRPVGSLRVEWLFGRVSKTVRTGEARQKPSKARPQRQAERKAGTRKRGGRIGKASLRLVWDLLQVRGLVANLVDSVLRLVRCIRLRVLLLDLRADLGDPADTALLVGAASQCAMYADLWLPCDLRLTPVFMGEPLVEGHARLSVRLRPICTLPPILRLVFSGATLRALVVVVRSRWKRGD